MAGGDGQGHQMNLVLFSPPTDLKEGGPQIVICQVMPLEKHSQHGQTGAQTLNFSLARLVIGIAWKTAVIQALSVLGRKSVEHVASGCLTASLDGELRSAKLF